MEWIKITPDTMPPECTPILVSVDRNGKKETRCAEFCVKVFWSLETDWSGEPLEEWRKEATHWMPLPEPASD